MTQGPTDRRATRAARRAEAHWCPHCQAAVPVVRGWVAAGGVPEGVDLVSVATSIDPSAPNYPPDAWLDREGWTAPLIVDPTNTVAEAYGLTAFPFWVFIGPDGDVRGRVTGELPITDLQATIRTLTATWSARTRTPGHAPADGTATMLKPPST